MHITLSNGDPLVANLVDRRRTFLGIIPGGASADEMGGAVFNDDATSGDHKERRRPVIPVFAFRLASIRLPRSFDAHNLKLA